MSFQLNPMGLNGPGTNNPYVQPNTANPTPAQSGSIASYPVGANMLGVTWPVSAYTQPGQTDTQPAWVNSGGASPTVV